jgi:hypothetical protein
MRFYKVLIGGYHVKGMKEEIVEIKKIAPAIFKMTLKSDFVSDNAVPWAVCQRLSAPRNKRFIEGALSAYAA